MNQDETNGYIRSMVGQVRALNAQVRPLHGRGLSDAARAKLGDVGNAISALSTSLDELLALNLVTDGSGNLVVNHGEPLSIANVAARDVTIADVQDRINNSESGDTVLWSHERTTALEAETRRYVDAMGGGIYEEKTGDLAVSW